MRGQVGQGVWGPNQHSGAADEADFGATPPGSTPRASQGQYFGETPVAQHLHGQPFARGYLLSRAIVPVTWKP